jgi:hypothetical protein
VVYQYRCSYKETKRELLKEFEKLDLKYEAGLLRTGDKDRMDLIVQDLESIWNLEEIKARQRSRDRNVKEGDRNTSYFHALANQRARKKRISMLETEDGVLEDTKDMLEHVLLFYKNLFGCEESLGVKLGEDFWDEGDKVTSQENELLEAPSLRKKLGQLCLNPMPKGLLAQMVSLLCFTKSFGRQSRWIS